MIKQYTTKSDVNVYIEAAIELGLEYEILSERNPTVIIRNGDLELLFRNTSPSFNSLAGHQIASDKFMTTSLLKKRDIPVPNGEIFEKEDIKGIIKYAEANYPVVIKRNRGAQGKDVFVNITNTNDLFLAIHDLLKSNCHWVIVEDFIQGKDYRVIVFRGEVIDIIERVPAYVVGNGKDSIEALIDQKNKLRRETIGNYPIKIDSALKNKISKKGYSLESVIDEGENLTVNSSCNYSSGGETKKINLDSVHASNLELFEKIQKVSFLDYVGIDYITPDISESWENTKSVINEINSSIGIDTHYYADMAMDLSAPKKILSIYFGINE